MPVARLTGSPAQLCRAFKQLLKVVELTCVFSVAALLLPQWA